MVSFGIPSQYFYSVLVSVSDETSLAIENEHGILLFRLDFNKAFDTLWHEILIAKLTALRPSDSSSFCFSSYLETANNKIDTCV